MRSLKLNLAILVAALPAVVLFTSPGAVAAPQPFSVGVKNDFGRVAGRHSGDVVYWQNKTTFVVDHRIEDLDADSKGVAGYLQVLIKGEGVDETRSYYASGNGDVNVIANEKYSYGQPVASIRAFACTTENGQVTLQEGCRYTNYSVDNPYVKGEGEI